MSIVRIGNLSSYIKGVALDLQVGEEATIDNTGTMHESKGHGYHGDLYYIKRISESEVILEKLHTDELD